MSRWLPVNERRKRDKKIVKLYQQGVSSVGLRIRFPSVNPFQILRKYGVEPNRRPGSIYSGLRRLGKTDGV